MAKTTSQKRHEPLALKYRPQRFADLAGQDQTASTLRQAVAGQRLKPAYMFSGTRGVGKTSAARIFARAVNCLQPIEGEPCNQCEACLTQLEGRSSDIFEIDAASYTKVDQTREVLAGVIYQPLSLRYKVYIIDEAHMLSKASFNALLKTLEEPPPHVIFVLATTEPEKILPTVRSRCQKYTFGALKTETLHKMLATTLQSEGIVFEDAALEVLACEANGSARDGLSLLDQIVSAGEGITLASITGALGLADRTHLGELLAALANRNAGEVARLCRIFQQQGTGTRQLGQQLIGLLHTFIRQRALGESHSDSPLHSLGQADLFRLAELLFQGWEAALRSPLADTRFEIALIRIATLTPLDDLLHGRALPTAATEKKTADSAKITKIADKPEPSSAASSPTEAHNAKSTGASLTGSDAEAREVIAFKNRALDPLIKDVLNRFDGTVLEINDVSGKDR